MAKMGFACRIGEKDLCFFNGSCVVDSIQGVESCNCPIGFSHDFTLFHDLNCVLPDQALFIFFIEYSSLAILLVIALIYNGGRRRQKVFKRLVGFVVFCMICSGLFSMALWLEGGLFHGSLVMLVLYVWAFLRSIMEVTELVFNSASSIVESRPFTKRYLTITTRTAAVFEIGLVSMVCALLVLCRTLQYNLVLSISMLITCAFNVVIIALMFREIGRLSMFAKRECTRLPSGNEVLFEKWRDFSYRMRLLRVSVCIYSMIFVCGAFSLPIVHFVLGSAPFAWCFVFAAVHVVYVACVTIYLFLRQPMSSTRHSFFAVGENMDSEEVSAFRGVFGIRTPIIKGKIRASLGKMAVSSRAYTGQETHVDSYESNIEPQNEPQF